MSTFFKIKSFHWINFNTRIYEWTQLVKRYIKVGDQALLIEKGNTLYVFVVLLAISLLYIVDNHSGNIYIDFNKIVDNQNICFTHTYTFYRWSI